MKKILRKVGFSAAAFLASVGVASAAVDAGVTTAISNAGTDGATIGGAILGVLVAIVAFKYLRKAL